MQCEEAYTCVKRVRTVCSVQSIRSPLDSVVPKLLHKELTMNLISKKKGEKAETIRLVVPTNQACTILAAAVNVTEWTNCFCLYWIFSHCMANCMYSPSKTCFGWSYEHILTQISSTHPPPPSEYVLYWWSNIDISVSKLLGFETFANFLRVPVSISENRVSENKSLFRFWKIWSRKQSLGFGNFGLGKKVSTSENLVSEKSLSIGFGQN